MEKFDVDHPIDVTEKDFDFDKEIEDRIPFFFIEIPSMDEDHAKTYVSNEIVLIEETDLDENDISNYIGQNEQGGRSEVYRATENIYLQPNVQNFPLLDIPVEGDDRKHVDMEIIDGPLVAINIVEIMDKSKSSGIEVTYLDEDGLGSGTNDVVTRNTGWFLFPVDFVKTQMKIYPQFNPRRLMDRANFKTVAESKKLGDDVGKNIFSFLGGKRRVSTLRQTKTNKRNKCKGKSKGKSTKVKMSGGSKKKVKNNRKTRKLKT